MSALVDGHAEGCTCTDCGQAWLRANYEKDEDRPPIPESPWRSYTDLLRLKREHPDPLVRELAEELIFTRARLDRRAPSPVVEDDQDRGDCPNCFGAGYVQDPFSEDYAREGCPACSWDEEEQASDERLAWNEWLLIIILGLVAGGCLFWVIVAVERATRWP